MKVRALLDHFGDLESAWRASRSDLCEAGLDRRALTSLLNARGQLDLDAEMDKLAKQHVRALTWLDSDYMISDDKENSDS